MHGLSDTHFIQRAISLAMRGRGTVEPNPMVGCVLVRDDRVIGEGWHKAPGGPHAEPSAVADCIARSNSPAGATAYVTLEPCCHTDKRTPPCVPLLIGSGVRRVVVGCSDPNPQVNGRGIAQLRAAGIEVTTGLLEAECSQLIAPFIGRVSLGRPYVTLKWAQSADGLISGAGKSRRQISGPEANAAVHLLRARCDAILVGGQTLRSDDPLLTARPVPGSPSATKPLLRCVISRTGELPGGSKLFNTPDEGEVLVFSSSLPEMLADLHRRGVTHLLVESGGDLAHALNQANLADRAWVISSPSCIREPGVRATRLDWSWTASLRLGADTLTELLNPKSELFFAPEPSADVQAVSHLAI